ncbi:MAG TPA: hypothetical protein VI298_10625 [Geobacteraceae bacterium]
MRFSFALPGYIILATIGIAFASLRLSPRPCAVHAIRKSSIHLIEYVLFILTASTAIYLGFMWYIEHIPAKQNLVEIKATVKNVAVESRMLKYLTLNGDQYGLKYLVDAPVKSEAAQLLNNHEVHLLIDKYPDIKGKTIRVWEIKIKEGIALSYEDLTYWRNLSGILKITLAMYPLLLLVIAYVVVFCFRKREDRLITKGLRHAANEVDSKTISEKAPVHEVTQLPEADSQDETSPTHEAKQPFFKSYGGACTKSFGIGILLTFVFPFFSFIVGIGTIFIVSMLGGGHWWTRQVFAYAVFIPLFFVLAKDRYREGKTFLAGLSSCSSLVRIVTDSLLVISFAAGMAGSIWCYHHHICRRGHFAHDFTSSDVYLDVLWGAGLVLSAILAAWLRRSYAQILIAFVTWIIVYRFLMGSGGGLSPFPF